MTESDYEWLKVTTVELFSWIIDDILTFFGGDIFILLEPFFLWSRATPHFNQKIATYGGNYIEVHHFENRKCLKIAIFCLKCCVRVICVFFVPLLAWGRITPQIIQKNLIIVIILLRSTLLAPEVRKMAYLVVKLTFFPSFISSEPLILYFSFWSNFSIVGIYFSSRSDLYPFLINFFLSSK